AKLLPIVPEAPLRELPDDWLMWTVLLRAIYKRLVPERCRLRLMRLASEWRGGPSELVSVAEQRGLDSHAIVAATAAGDWEQIAGRAKDEDGGSHPASKLALAWRRVHHLLKTLIDPKPYGLCVAVVGPD